MAAKTVRRALFRLLLAVGVVLWGSTLFLMAQTAQNSAQFSRLHEAMLLINGAGVLLLLVLIGGNLARLIRDYRKLVPGSRLRARMVTMFAALAVVPVLIVFYYAVQFLNRGIDSWFNVEVEQGFEQALELSRTALELRKREYMDRTRGMARYLARWPETLLAQELSLLRRENDAREITVAGANSRIVATSSDRSSALLPSVSSAEILYQTRGGMDYVSLDPLPDGGYVIRTADQLETSLPGAEPLVLIVEYEVPQRLGQLADNVLAAYNTYGELKYLRQPLKISLTLTLSLVLFLALLLAVYGAFSAARRLLQPIPDLLAGTRAVAKGDFELRLPQHARDELGFLVDSFNDMMRRLSRAREEARHHQQQVEKERTNLEIILARLSTGVLALDQGLKVRNANQAAGAILDTDLDNAAGKDLGELAADSPMLGEFLQVVKPHLQRGEKEWREQIVLRGEGGRRVLICACTALPGEAGGSGGVVVVFDDITALLQAQRDAAWGEVARRLAHEIKNPLTPIQLSAERLRRRYLGSMDEQEAQVLDRATHIIVQQVEAMKEMVDAFRDYARAPDLELSDFSVNEIVMEVADMYRLRELGVRLQVNLDNNIPPLRADRGRLRQILHNLLRNGSEALEGQNDGEIIITTRLRSMDDHQAVEIAVEDNGPGFTVDIVDQVFDPYVTSKPKGTGLGLAIVKKMVEEHGGHIDARNRDCGGARVELVLPLNEASRGAMMPRLARRNESRRESA